MQNDALDAGVRPGGLRSKQDIKILICYIISKTRAGLSPDTIEKALVRAELVNYFESSDCMSDLIKNGNINVIDGVCELTQSGMEVASLLEMSLPPSVRDRAVQVTLELFEQERRERENTVNITRCDNGYNVECKVLGGAAGDLLSLSINVADSRQASLIKENFLKNPEIIYKSNIALLTGNWDFAKDTLESMEKEKRPTEP